MSTEKTGARRRQWQERALRAEALRDITAARNKQLLERVEKLEQEIAALRKPPEAP